MNAPIIVGADCSQKTLTIELPGGVKGYVIGAPYVEAKSIPNDTNDLAALTSPFGEGAPSQQAAEMRDYLRRVADSAYIHFSPGAIRRLCLIADFLDKNCVKR